MMYEVETILATYTEQDAAIIRDAMKYSILAGTAAPTVETFRAWADGKLAAAAAEKEKAARKAAREAEKAAAVGMTVEQYKAHKANKAAAKRHENEAARLAAEIERLKELVAYHERKAAEYRKGE